MRDVIDKIDRELLLTVMPENGDGVIKRKRPRLVKKAKTHPNKGGWRGHPNSLRALERHRARTMLGGEGLKRCRHCRKVAVRGLAVCQAHGGAPVVKRRRIEDGCAVFHRPRIAARFFERLVANGEIPRDLVAVPAFRSVNDVCEEFRVRVQEARRAGNPLPRIDRAEMRYRNAARLLRLEMVRGWAVMEADGDHGPWMAAIAKARDLGFMP